MTDLISRLKDSFSDLFEAKGIQFSTENEDALQRVHLEMEYRQNLFMILKEAIHNAIKYSDASEIQLSVLLNGKILSIQLKDNGKGFDTDQMSSGNGLHNMKTRAEKISGQVNITSSNGNGTVIEFKGKV
ncbi:MAG: ATP-binding protein [Calditrichaceae bacterium]